MTLSAITITMALALGSAGQCPDPSRCSHGQYQHSHLKGSGGWVLPDGPGDGWGFPNGAPDGYGWFDAAPLLPLGGNRTPEYYFPRQFALPPEQAFMGTYYNPYLNRGQRYIPYTGSGGDHPAGGAPLDSARTPVNPYTTLNTRKPLFAVPRLNGRVEAPIENSGKTGLTP
jgi:hypothetical protein